MSITTLSERQTDKLRPYQVKFMEGLVIDRKRRQAKKTTSLKRKYYCPTYRDDYSATTGHKHCKLCHTDHKGDLHEVIEFDQKVHKP